MRLLIRSLIRSYRKFISPMLGHNCRFYPSCSAYAEEAFETKSFLVATGKTIKRIFKCHPFHPGGYDPVNTWERA